MVRVEMLHDDEGKTGVRRHVCKKTLKRFKAAGRCPHPYYGEEFLGPENGLLLRAGLIRSALLFGRDARLFLLALARGSPQRKIEVNRRWRRHLTDKSCRSNRSYYNKYPLFLKSGESGANERGAGFDPDTVRRHVVADLPPQASTPTVTEK